jgi:hypothetical protein
MPKPKDMLDWLFKTGIKEFIKWFKSLFSWHKDVVKIPIGIDWVEKPIKWGWPTGIKWGKIDLFGFKLDWAKELIYPASAKTIGKFWWADDLKYWSIDIELVTGLASAGKKAGLKKTQNMWDKKHKACIDEGGYKDKKDKTCNDYKKKPLVFKWQKGKKLSAASCSTKQGHRWQNTGTGVLCVWRRQKGENFDCGTIVHALPANTPRVQDHGFT